MATGAVKALERVLARARGAFALPATLAAAERRQTWAFASTSAFGPAAERVIDQELKRISSEVESELNMKVPEEYQPQMKYLLSVGVEPPDLLKLVRREMTNPHQIFVKKLLHRTDLNAKVEYLQNEFKLDGWQIGKLIFRATNTIMSKDHSLQKRVDFLLEQGMSRHDMVKAFYRSSKLFTLQTKETIEPRLASLMRLFRISPNHKDDFMSSLVVKHPEVLEVSEELAERNVLWLQARGYDIDQIKEMCYRHGLILVYSPDAMAEKVKLFQSRGFTDEQVWKIFYLSPHLLGLSLKKNIIPTLNFFMTELEWDQRDITSLPRILNCSLSKRIKPRFAFLKQARPEEYEAYSRKSKWLMMKDEDFVNKICKSNLEKWKDFNVAFHSDTEQGRKLA